jgi:hypothetical protein
MEGAAVARTRCHNSWIGLAGIHDVHVLLGSAVSWAKTFPSFCLEHLLKLLSPKHNQLAQWHNKQQGTFVSMPLSTSSFFV